MSKQVNIRLDDASIATLDAVAERLGRSRSALVQRAVSAFIAQEQARIEAIKKSIAEADAGLLIPAEQVFAELDALIDAYEQKNAA
jgi:predicted transcriptional regulator